jgi:glyoxylase-like metal-dependent hydrolase (beta-lactamase superfamily II)
MKIYKYSVGPLGTNSYIVSDEETSEAFIVDPGDDGEKLISAVESKCLKLKFIILTHGHFDHIMAINHVIEKTNAKLYIHSLDAPMLADPSLSLMSRFSTKKTVFPTPDAYLSDRDVITIGNSEITIVHTPGHTQGSICIKVGADLISGDTLFRESVGRSDFPGGDFKTLLTSLKTIVALDIKGKIYPGHGMSTTMAHELEYNTYLM